MESTIPMDVQKFRKQGVKYLEKLCENDLCYFVEHANNCFFNDQSIITDNEYDIIKEFLTERYPENAQTLKVGACVKRNKVTLPYYMGSMDKIKPDSDALKRWKQKFKGPFTISAKLDGVSGLYSTEDGVQKLYTRGNGTVGQDVSNLIPYLRLPKEKDITVRGEFIITKDKFEKKYKDLFANSRNFVSGIINSKTPDKYKLKDIDFVVYEMIHPEEKHSSQLEKMKKLKFNVVLHKIVKDVSNKMLSDELIDTRTNYKYECDGIIVTCDHIFERKDKNPEHAFAFKMMLTEQIAETKILNIEWNPSKDGYLKPRIQIEPITLGGVTINFTTGFNAAFVMENQLGIGAVIRIIRSGDVIPYITETISPAEQVSLPDYNYKWNETKVDFVLKNPDDNDEVKSKNIVYFFTEIGVEGLSKGNIQKLINNGIDTIGQILTMKKDDLLEIPGFQDKLASKILRNIKSSIKEVDLPTLMHASNMFGHGFGEKKFKLILNEHPDIVSSNISDEEKIELIESVKGMAHKSAVGFVREIPTFLEFIRENNLSRKLKYEVQVNDALDTSHPLYNKTIVFTGFRDQEVQTHIETNYNTTLGSSVNKNTMLVVCKNVNEKSSKLDQAKKLKIPIMSVDDFKKKYI
jgi:NAD-dependent DNA ligase